MSVSGSVVVGEYGVREVVMFLLKSLGGRVYSVKKLMKLVFLAQYDVDVERRVVYEYRYGGRPLARAEFYIWSYGPMSNEVYDVLESGDFDLVSGELGLEICYAGPVPQLPRPVAARLSDVAAKYGGWKPWQLERYVNQLLGLDIPEKKSDYMGVWLNSYLRVEGYSLMPKELHG
jgi:uncharacterized phage-associated protein